MARADRPSRKGGSHRKAHLPEKVCPVCERPFAWRKKWALDWEKVRYCSKSCAGRAKRD